MSIKAIRGFNDILPGPSALWRYIEGEAARHFSTYGFREIRLPIVEKTELFKRAVGETTDIVEKEMYTFEDRRGDSLTLRPEGTAPAVRAYIEHKLYTSPETRLYYTGPMYRYERPQKGRYRQFYQIGAEVLGPAAPETDGEVMEMLISLFATLGVSDAELQINSLGCPECRPGFTKELTAFLEGVKEALCENCRRRIGENPLRALDCKSPGCIEATKGAPRTIEFLCDECDGHFEGVKGYLKEGSVEAKINPRMVRGLDYYTKTAFEVTAGGLGSQNAVAAGGRYDSLVKELGGPDTPCFGFAIGMERLVLSIEDGEAGEGGGVKKSPLIYLLTVGEKAGGHEARQVGRKLAEELRSGGSRVMTDYGGAELKKKMKKADRVGARYAVIIGEDEVSSKTVTMKDLSSGEQQSLSIDEAAALITGEG